MHRQVFWLPDHSPRYPSRAITSAQWHVADRPRLQRRPPRRIRRWRNRPCSDETGSPCRAGIAVSPAFALRSTTTNQKPETPFLHPPDALPILTRCELSPSLPRSHSMLVRPVARISFRPTLSDRTSPRSRAACRPAIP